MTYVIEVNNGRKWKRFCFTEEEYLEENLNNAKEMHWKIRYREFPNGTNKWKYVKGDLYTSIM